MNHQHNTGPAGGNPGRPAPGDFRQFAAEVVARHDEHLLDYGPEEQAARVVEALERVNRVTTLAPLAPVADLEVDLAGFGVAPVHFVTDEDDYLLLSDIAEQLGWFQPRAHAWAEQQHDFAVQDQRRKDEERGDGRLGWELMLDYIDLDLCLCVDDPEAQPDAGGHRWSHSGDWLISKTRLPLLLSCSPWGREFIDNVSDHYGLALQGIWGDKLKDIPTVNADGTPTGNTAYDMFHSDLTEEEALRKARRGPALDDQDRGQL